MNFLQAIQPYGGQPLTHQMLLSVLKDYERPNDKIHELLSSGLLISIRRGLYLAPDSRQPEPFLLANHMYGPSYVSMDSALSAYGLIPERVYTCTSATTKTAKEYCTPAGTFTYTRLPLPYFSFGLVRRELAPGQWALVASPEKALLDKVATTTGLLLRSRSAAFDYLFDNLRMDETQLKKLDIIQMEQWLPNAPKKESMSMVLKALRTL